MLLRSSSTPILKSWIPPHYTNTNSSPNNINEPTTPCLSRTNSISTRSPSSSPSSPTPNTNHSRLTTSCTLFDLDLHDPPYPKSTPLQRLFSSSSIDEAVSMTEDGGGSDGVVVCSGDGKGMDGGDWYGGGGSGFNDGYSSNNNDAPRSIEAYYQKMIEANPENPLLLSNYAKFLKDIRGDLAKAEKYCERAILSSPGDAKTLSLYAHIIWQHRRDVQRAETYFDQAIKAAPDDCYVLASYANFLWNVEEEETQDKVGYPSSSPPRYLEGTSHRPPLTTS